MLNRLYNVNKLIHREEKVKILSKHFLGNRCNGLGLIDLGESTIDEERPSSSFGI